MFLLSLVCVVLLCLLLLLYSLMAVLPWIVAFLGLLFLLLKKEVQPVLLI